MWFDADHNRNRCSSGRAIQNVLPIAIDVIEIHHLQELEHNLIQLMYETKALVMNELMKFCRSQSKSL